MPLRSKEPPERPLAPTDLSHRNLICICHRPSICHPRFPTRCDLSLFLLPLRALSPVLPSRRLDIRLIPQNRCAPTSPKARPAARSADVKTVALANLAVPRTRPIDIALGRSRPLWTD